jgi:hypothetical protein
MKLWKYIVVLVELFAPVAVLAGAYAVGEEHYSPELPAMEQATKQRK